jgi:hypothetical protein
LTQVLVIVIVVKVKTSIPSTLNPFESDVTPAVDLCLEFGILGADLVDGMIRGQVCLFPSSVHLLLILVKLDYILDGPLQDSTLVLVAVWNQLSNLVDSLVNGLTAAAFNCNTLEQVAMVI